MFAGPRMEGKGKPSPGAARHYIPPRPDSWGSHLSPVGKKGCAVPKASGPRPRSPPCGPCSILQETHPLASSFVPLACAHLSVPHLPSSSGGPVGRPVSPSVSVTPQVCGPWQALPGVPMCSRPGHAQDAPGNRRGLVSRPQGVGAPPGRELELPSWCPPSAQGRAQGPPGCIFRKSRVATVRAEPGTSLSGPLAPFLGPQGPHSPVI